MDEASLAVVFEIVKSHGDAAQGLKSAVDGFSKSVGRVLVDEVGQKSVWRRLRVRPRDRSSGH